MGLFSGSTFNMVAGTLYTYPENFVFGETNKTPEFTKKFPLGKVPAFEGSDGTLLTESNAIAYYVANDELRGGSDAASRAQVVQWMCWADSEVLPASCTWVFPCMGIMQYNKSSTERAKEDIKAALNQLNTHLLTKTFLVGERISLADIAVCCTMINLFKLVLDPAFRKSYVNVTRWFTTVVNQPNVKAVVGSVALCTKMAEFDAKKYAEFSGKGKKEEKPGKGKKEEKKKEAKPEKVEKAETPAAEAPAMPPKKKDPLDELPAGTFNMEDWKRFFSNNPEEEAIKYFWDNFDTTNYSIWRCDYKYNDELTMVFMSMNLIGGMFQRLEKMKKNAFASVCLFGESRKSSLSGIWIWRGQELCFDLCEDWQIDCYSYDWKKLDPTSDDTKAQVKQYFTHDESSKDLEGRAFNQGMILK